mgnify:CR=1 FL=1
MQAHSKRGGPSLRVYAMCLSCAGVSVRSSACAITVHGMCGAVDYDNDMPTACIACAPIQVTARWRWRCKSSSAQVWMLHPAQLMSSSTADKYAQLLCSAPHSPPPPLSGRCAPVRRLSHRARMASGCRVGTMPTPQNVLHVHQAKQTMHPRTSSAPSLARTNTSMLSYSYLLAFNTCGVWQTV